MVSWGSKKPKPQHSHLAAHYKDLGSRVQRQHQKSTSHEASYYKQEVKG
jgi:hypothetical protein